MAKKTKSKRDPSIMNKAWETRRKNARKAKRAAIMTHRSDPRTIVVSSSTSGLRIGKPVRIKAPKKLTRSQIATEMWAKRKAAADADGVSHESATIAALMESPNGEMESPSRYERITRHILENAKDFNAAEAALRYALAEERDEGANESMHYFRGQTNTGLIAEMIGAYEVHKRVSKTRAPFLVSALTITAVVEALKEAGYSADGRDRRPLPF